MQLEGKRVAVLAADLYEDLELWYPVLRLREAGAAVTIVGTGADQFTSKHGYPVQADLSASDAKVENFDAIVIPGGYSPDHMRRDKAMVNLVRSAAEKGKVVAAICHAGWMLASANIIRGKHVTCYFSIKDDIINAGGEYEDSEVVQDGNIITSRQPDDLPAFCRTIIQALTRNGTA